MIQIQIKDKLELMALHKALMEAKFNSNPDSQDIQGSPYVAKIANKVLDKIIEEEYASGRNDKAKEWEDWRDVDKTRREYTLLVERIHEYQDWWLQSNNEEKEEFIVSFISPLRLSKELLNELLENKGESTK